ncbi:MAG: HYR domain-containing protein, partial [Flavobacteriaceae bacterium]|nr:HYR domain-containing protein [Flavobacteriaceae bacterium]
MRKNYILPILFLFGLILNIKAQTAINDTYLILNFSDGTIATNQYYDLQANTINDDFINGYDLGIFESTATLILNGAEQNTTRCNADWITDSELQYRIYPTTTIPGSEPGFVPISIIYNSDLGSAGCAGTDQRQRWQTTQAGIDVLNGLSPGNYYLEVFTLADYDTSSVPAGILYASNGGFNYRGTFEVDADDPPTAVCQDITIQLDAAGNATIVAADIDGGSTDDNGIASLSASQTSFGCGDVGANTVTLTVTDTGGNSATCNATVTVEDNENPTITCPGDVTVECGDDTSSTSTGSATGSDNCSLTISSSDSFTATCGNTNIISRTWTATDPSGNSVSCVQTITVVDTTDPSITLPADATVECTGDTSSAATGVATGSDSCGTVTVTQSDTSVPGCGNTETITRTWTVTDQCGNTASGTQTITVVDTTDPSISCPGDQNVDFDGMCSFTLPNYTGLATTSDTCGNVAVTQSPAPGTIINVTTTITLTATDECGNTSSCTFDVIPADNTNPVASCQDLTIQLDPGGTFTINASQIDNGSSDNCSIVSYTLSRDMFTCADVGNFPTVTLTVTDAVGNTDSCTATVTVEDITPPAASCVNSPVVITLDPITGEASITTADADNGSLDTCSSVTLSLSQTIFTCDDIGDNTETLTVTDAQGNSSTCTFTVTVDAPTITSGTLTGEVIDPIPANPQPPDDLIEVTACPGGISEPKDIQLTLNLDASSTIIPANISTWQTSTDNGASWTNVGGTAGQTQVTLLDLITTTLVRVVIQAGNCIEYSPLAVIRFLPPEAPPTIVSISATDICLGDTVTVVAESYFETPGGGQWGDGGLFNQAQPDGWRVDGLDGFFPASGDNQSEPTWKETNGPTYPGGIRYDTSDNTKFAIAWGPYTTTLETPIFNTVGMDPADAILEFHHGYYFCNGAQGYIELSLDGGDTYNITLNTMQGDNLTSPSDSGTQVNGKNGTNCGGGPNGQKPTSDPLQLAQLDLGAWVDMANLRVRFTYDGLGHGECEDEIFPPHPGNTCSNIPNQFDVYSTWAIDDVGFPFAYVEEELEWTDENGVVVATGSTVVVTPITPGVREYGVTGLVNGCRADTDIGTEFININTSLAYAGQNITPAAGECGQATFDLNAYDNTLTSVDNFNNGAWNPNTTERGYYVVPDLGAGDMNFAGTNVGGNWSIISGPAGTCGAPATFSSTDNPRATFTGEPGTYVLRWTLDNGCFDEMSLTINSCVDIDFDGVDDYVTFKNNYPLDAAFTVNLWVKPNATNGTRTMLSKRLAGSNTGYEFVLQNGTPTFNWYSSSGNGSISTSNNINTSRWFHLSVTFDGAAYTMYIDGIDVTGASSGTINAPEASPANVECIVGARDGAAGFSNNAENHYYGWMDELSIWDTALTADQIRHMMNQEIDNNGGAVRGVIVPLDIPGITWANLDGYYRMNENCGYFAAYKGVNGRLRNINSSMPQTAPIPYTSRVDGQLWGTDNTWTHFDVWDPPNSNGVEGTAIDWNIAVISHDIDSGDRDITLLGLISDTPNKELTIADPGPPQDETNDGQAIWITHYYYLDGIINLVGESQLLQKRYTPAQVSESILDVNSGGYGLRSQQGTTNEFNYNYWSSPFGPQIVGSNNNDYSISSVLLDGSTSNNPQNIAWTSAYDATGSVNPITLSRSWIYAYENYPQNTYANWSFKGENGTLAPGLGFTMKGSAVGDPVTDVQNYVFRGKPYVGSISSPITAGNDAFVGNPYTSTLDADEFIRDNIPLPNGNPGTTESITGTLYFWVHYTSNLTHFLELYEGGYAQYNLTGGVGPVTPPITVDGYEISGSGSSPLVPTQYIPVAQGFFVNASPAGGVVSFHNDQRVFRKESDGSAVFMEANNQELIFGSDATRTDSRDINDDTIKRVRINFTSALGSIRELLLGFVPNGEATDGFDYGYD